MKEYLKKGYRGELLEALEAPEKLYKSKNDFFELPHDGHSTAPCGDPCGESCYGCSLCKGCYSFES